MTPFQIVESLLQEGYKYAVTLIDLEDRLSDFVVEWGQINVPDEWLYRPPEDDSMGRELHPHVTVKYGLTVNEVPDSLREIVKGTKPFPIYLGRISLFTTSPDYDVVKIDVESPWLRRLNQQISVQIPNEDKWPTYHPHVTVAYVKKGTAVKLSGVDPFASGDINPEFVAYGLEFKGACEDCDNPARTKEMLLFSRVKEPAVQEADEPELNAKQYIIQAFDAIRAEPVPAKIVSDETGETIEFDAREGLSHLPDDWIQWLRLENFERCEPADRVADYGGDAVQVLQNLGPYEVYIDAEAAEKFVPYRPRLVDRILKQLGRTLESEEPELNAKEFINRAVNVYYIIKPSQRSEFSWNKDWGWVGRSRSPTRYSTPEEAQALIDKRAAGFGEVVPVLESNGLAEADPEIGPERVKAIIKSIPIYYLLHAQFNFDDGTELLNCYVDSAGGLRNEPQKLVYREALLLKKQMQRQYPMSKFSIVPSKDQSQMYWQGRRWPQDFWGTEVTEAQQSAVPDPYREVGFPADATRMKEFERARRKRRKRTVL